MGKPVVYWEFWSKEGASVSKFYEEVFGWKIQYIPDINYRFVDTGAGFGINGGIKPQEGPRPGNITLYIDVDDLDAYAQKIEAAGGKVIVAKQEVPNMGSYSLFQDPDGRVLGIWKQVGQQF